LPYQRSTKPRDVDDFENELCQVSVKRSKLQKLGSDGSKQAYFPKLGRQRKLALFSFWSLPDWRRKRSLLDYFTKTAHHPVNMSPNTIETSRQKNDNWQAN
jgi:hypothetical protein